MTHYALFFLLLRYTIESQVIYAFNCGAETHLTTPIVKYYNDLMYDPLNSRTNRKPTLPGNIVDPIDIQLLLTDRTTDSTHFSYNLKMKGPDHYLLIFKFIETAFDKQSERVFEIRIGDEIIFEVDIVKEVGAGQVLHKWIQIDLRDDVIYINNTFPTLNAYQYSNQAMRITFQRVKGQPKIEALVLVKGYDSQKFLNEYLEQQVAKNTRAKEYTSQKYHRPIQFHYKHMTGSQSFDFPEQNLSYYLKKLFSLNSLFSIMVIVVVLFHDAIYEKLNLSFQKNGTNKKWKQQ